jgi:hypothetical protein
LHGIPGLRRGDPRWVLRIDLFRKQGHCGMGGEIRQGRKQRGLRRRWLGRGNGGYGWILRYALRSSVFVDDTLVLEHG